MVWLFADACANSLNPVNNPCLRCAVPSPTPNLFCGTCLSQTRYFDKITAPYLYQPPTDLLIQSFKFANALHVGHVMTTLLSHHLGERTAPWPEILIPVPLHPSRLLARGFNQATEMALGLSKLLNIPVDTKSYVRDKQTQAQSGLSKAEREQNIHKAFRARKTSTAKHVAIIDDVVTTTSTVNGLAKVVRSNGAEVIEVWCFARAR